MAQRISEAIAETAPASLEDLWWLYLKDLGRYPLSGLPATGPAALHAWSY